MGNKIPRHRCNRNAVLSVEVVGKKVTTTYGCSICLSPQRTRTSTAR